MGASGWYLLGAELRAFEAEFAAYVDTRHCVGVANGLEALRLSLLALGVGPGDEVIVPSNTYIATWLAVTQAGAVPVPVEPDPATYTIDPARIGDAITARTRVILPVHLYGHPADMDPIMALARERGLKVLDDAAQAQGTRYRGQRVGGLADITAWSFYPAKNLGALGDAGAVTTADDVLADRVRVLRNYGSRVKYVNEVRGFNSRLDEVQAAVLRCKLEHLDTWNGRRAQIAQYYSRALGETQLALPREAPWAESCWHLYVIRTPGREELERALSVRGIETLIHYPIPPHRQAAYADLEIHPDALPLASAMAEEVLSLPLGPHLPPDQQRMVVEAVLEHHAAQAG